MDTVVWPVDAVVWPVDAVVWPVDAVVWFLRMFRYLRVGETGVGETGISRPANLLSIDSIL